MSTDKTSRPKARLPRGFRDRGPSDIAAERRMLETIRKVYESYGFEPLETPAFEYTDALGKFLPDLDRPNEGVFSLKDDDGQWLSLRYDLTAPLARYVAENFQNLPKPFRRYQVGQVWRNEKPGPGRYREFTQFDADTVGSTSPAADAELLMMVCDALEAAEIPAVINGAGSVVGSPRCSIRGVNRPTIPSWRSRSFGGCRHPSSRSRSGSGSERSRHSQLRRCGAGTRIS